MFLVHTFRVRDDFSSFFLLQENCVKLELESEREIGTMPEGFLGHCVSEMVGPHKKVSKKAEM